MLKATLRGAACALALAVPAAHASEIQKAGVAPVKTALPDDVVEVQTPHRNAAGVIVGDAIGGAVVGAAVGGGVALYNYETSSNHDWGNWQRDLAVGAGIGLAAGLVFGAIDAAGSADRAPVGPLSDQRQTGFGAYTPVYGMRF